MADSKLTSANPVQRPAVDGRLQIGASRCALVLGTNIDNAVTLDLQLGTTDRDRFRFHRQWPSPLEVETAIATIEDQIMPLATQVPKGLTVLGEGEDMVELAVLAVGADAPLTLEALEQLFNRWVAIVQGRPPGADVIAPSHRFAVTLLILRELFHHWALRAVIIDTGASRS